MIQIPFGAFTSVSVPTGADVTVAVPQADPLNFLTAQQPFQVVVFTAPAAEGGSGVTSWGDLEDKPSTFPPTAHKSTHATGGPDALSPGDIGAEVAGAVATHAAASNPHPQYVTAAAAAAAAPVQSVAGRAGTVTLAAADVSGLATHIVNTTARSAQIPDGTAAGGGNRGPNSVDLQSWRTLATHIASGSGSMIGGGRSNTASGSDTTVPGGTGNTASGERATVGGGEMNTASGTRAVISGGAFNLASGPNSGVPWGFAASTFGIFGAYAWQAQNRGNYGDNQQFGGLLGYTTVSATPTVLTADRTTPRTTANNINVHVLPNNSVWAGFVYVVVRDTATSEFTSWLFWVSAGRGANAAATTVTSALLHHSGWLSSGAVAVSGNTTRGSIEVTATGSGSELDWTCGFHGIMNYR